MAKNGTSKKRGSKAEIGNMDFTMNRRFIDYYRENKKETHFELLDEDPYEEIFEKGRRKFHYREEYVKKSVDKCKKIWESCGFSNDLSLVYEKGYEDHKGKEHAFLESCIKKLGYSMYSFVAEDLEEENLVGRRYVWKTDEIDMEKLAREIILSDIGGKLSLAESVFVVDNKNDKVFFLYDDRGILFYTEREK